MFPWYLKFSWRDLWSFPFYCFPLFLCIDLWGRLFYFSFPFFGTLHSNGYIFSFLPCFSHLFSQLFVWPPQTAMLLICISFPWGWSWSLPPVQCHEPPSIVMSFIIGNFYFFLFIYFLLWLLLLFFICSEFCHTLKWNSHGFTCVPLLIPPSHLPLHPLPLGLPSAPGPSACLMHPTWAGDLFHPR